MTPVKRLNEDEKVYYAIAGSKRCYLTGRWFIRESLDGSTQILMFEIAYQDPVGSYIEKDWWDAENLHIAIDHPVQGGEEATENKKYPRSTII